MLTVSFVLDVITYIEKQIEKGDIKEDTRVLREKIKVLKNIDENTRVTRELAESLKEKVEMLTEAVGPTNGASLQEPIFGEFYLICFCFALNLLMNAYSPKKYVDRA